MACPRCQKRGKTWNGNDPRCGFPDGKSFSADNWNCATLNRLRELDRDGAVYNDDQWILTLPFNGEFIVLGGYKRGGTVEYAGNLNEYKMEDLTLKRAEEVIKSRECPPDAW
jgi:hypothetical protein